MTSGYVTRIVEKTIHATLEGNNSKYISEMLIYKYQGFVIIHLLASNLG